MSGREAIRTARELLPPSHDSQAPRALLTRETSVTSRLADVATIQTNLGDLKVSIHHLSCDVVMSIIVVFFRCS